MKNLIRAGAWTFMVCAMVAVPRMARAASILQINGSGILIGATGVTVNGALYDVQFLDGTCAEIFSGCDDVADFDFTTASDALAASVALLDQVFIGQFDTQPYLVAGCDYQYFCVALTPYAIPVDNHIPAGGANNADGSTAFPPDNASVGLVPMVDTRRYESLTYADWAPAAAPAAVTPVPEPASLLLLGTGIAGIAAKIRKRRRGSENIP